MRSMFLLAIVLVSQAIVAQDYQISFAVLDNEEATIDSVVVQNLSQDLLITLRGDDILHLVASITGMSDLTTPISPLEIYPNPFMDRALISFYNPKPGPVDLAMFDMAGKLVAKNRSLQPTGKTSFEIRGLPAGAYVLQIDTETSSVSEIILSNDVSGMYPEIHVTGSGDHVVLPVASLKSKNLGTGLVDMQYNDGDTLSFTAYLGDFNSEIQLVPVASTTLSFEFHQNQDDMKATADITFEGGTLHVTDESGNRVTITFPPGAVMDTVAVSLTLLGEQNSLPVSERQLRAFEIRPLDVSLYEPVAIQVEYNAPVSEIEKATLFRIRSEEWLIPLSDHTYSDDHMSMTAFTYILGDFAEGKMSLEEINTQFDLLLSAAGSSWGSRKKSAGREKQLSCDTRIHKATWDDWRETIGGFLTIFRQRNVLGYYNDLEEGQPTYEEEQELLCENVVGMAIQDVLDLCIPEDLCDRDYTHTLASMVNGMNLLGCEDSIYDLLTKRFDQMLIDCASFLTINSILNIEEGGLEIETSGVVPIAVRLKGDKTATVEGSGTLKVDGKGSAGGACSSTVSGETLVTVLGHRDAAFSYDLQMATQQDALLTTKCPDVTVETPLVGDDILSGVLLNRANGYSYRYDGTVEGGTFTMEVLLNNPYTTLPFEQ